MRTYDELTGARGRKIYYRAERYPARELFRKIVPEVEIDGNCLILNDVSMSGLSASTSQAAPWVPGNGNEVTVALKMDDLVLFEAKAQVHRTESIPGGLKVGLGFVSGCLDISEVVTRHRDITARFELDTWLRSDTDLVPPEYRAVVAEVVFFLRRYRAVFERLSLKAGGQGHQRPALASDILAECEARGFPEWSELWLRANRAVLPLMDDPVALAAAKRFTEALVTPEFLPAPFVRRAYEKPLGYPGDFELMNYVYRWEALGDTDYAKFAHRIAVQSAECVATRMVIVRDAIVDCISGAACGGEESPVRITSLGAGPAQEVLNVLEAGQRSRPVEFTLIDQDRNALSYAYERTYPHTVRPGARSSVQCLQVSFMQLLSDRRLFETLPPQDMIYCMGLMDYLSPRRGRWLVSRLYDRLALGGRLMVANLRAGERSTFWPIEFICDWRLIYRNEQEMLALAEGLPTTNLRLDIDPTGHVYLLTVNKADR